ncbi:MAG: CAP domain-containing protein [Polyangiales bacterium]
MSRAASRSSPLGAFAFAALLALVARLIGAASAAPVTTPAPNPWAAETSSPRPGIPNDPIDGPLAKLCGGGLDASLLTVATEIAQVLAVRGELPDAQEIEWRQRKAGNPHVWPRTWGAHIDGAALDRTQMLADVKKWLGASAKRVRCGVATHRIGGAADPKKWKEAIAVIAIDPVADLSSLPTKAKVGTWIDLDATLGDGAASGRVILLPPSGMPKSILANTGVTDPPHVKARFLLGTAGRHVVQVLADDGNGPRPVLEAEVYAGVDPPMAPPSNVVPGENDGNGIVDPKEGLLARLQGARVAEGLGKLTKDSTLEKVAQAHAEAMMKAHLLAHDVGDGDPGARIAATGTTWKLVGENVAKAKTNLTAHRALYASPSHRGNMLEARFKKVGIGVAIDPKTGELWVAQMYGG